MKENTLAEKGYIIADSTVKLYRDLLPKRKELRLLYRFLKSGTFVYNYALDGKPTAALDKALETLALIELLHDKGCICDPDYTRCRSDCETFINAITSTPKTKSRGKEVQ